MAVNMELVGYGLAVIPLGNLETKGLLQTSKRILAEGREEVLLVESGFTCLLFSSSLEYAPGVLAMYFYKPWVA